MTRWLTLALLAASLHAATIRGNVVEKQTGKALARALIVAQPVVGSKGATRSARTDTHGVYEIDDVPAGMYIITASRTGFSSAVYGQKHWYAAGTPVALDANTDLSARFALPHFGAITGRVVDENNVGIPACKVLVYRNTRPPEVAENSMTDDRGVFRIWGLTPGTYLVRTAEMATDLGIFLPTFSREAQAVTNGLTHDAILDQDTPGADVRPLNGTLYSLSGEVRTPRPRTPSTVTLVSDMGSQTVTTEGNNYRSTFLFERLGPGTYELRVQTPDAGTTAPLSGYLTVDVDRFRSSVQLDVGPLTPVQFTFVDAAGKPVDATGLPFLIRRRDLAGPGKVDYLRLDDGSQLRLDPGRWEFSLGPNTLWYTAKFSGPGNRPAPESMNGWNEIVVAPGNPPAVKFTLAPSPGLLSGVVTVDGSPIPGAPVHLEALLPSSGRRILELRSTRTDIHGRYVFTGLAPGYYRVAATFEYAAPDTTQMTRAQAQEFTIGEERTLTRDLKLWVME
jgi:hypothetical protein